MDFDSGVVDAVKGYEYVSIDVYDTLLLRPYMRPTDVFRHMERKEDAPGFTEERIESEKRCMASPYPTTLDRIYEGMPERYRHLKEKELEYESNAVCPDRILATYREILKDHKVVIASDMYLPGEFIEGLLKKNGIDGYLRFYLSSEVGVSKGKGTMYGYIAEDLGIDKSRMIHVGDNLKSECIIPRKLGFNTVLVDRPSVSYFRKCHAVRRYYEKTRSLERSIIVGMNVIRNFQNDGGGFWKDISYRFGGPLTSDYVRFIADNRREEDVMMFAARDGYNLEKVMNILYPGIDTHYIYVPRILNILIGSSYRQHRDYKRLMVEEFYGPCDDPDAYYDEHEQEIMEKRAERFAAYRNNIVSENGIPPSIATVDVTTMKYSSQRLVDDMFPDSDVLGIYYFLLLDDPSVPHRAYHVRDRIIKLFDNINITEFFMTSPETPVTGIDADGRPVFREICADEKCRLDIYDDVTEGELSYARDLAHMFGDRMVPLGYRNVSSWIKVLVNGSGTETRKTLATIRWPVDAAHRTYISMIYHPRDTWFHIKKTILDLMWYVSTRIRR